MKKKLKLITYWFSISPETLVGDILRISITFALVSFTLYVLKYY